MIIIYDKILLYKLHYLLTSHHKRVVKLSSPPILSTAFDTLSSFVNSSLSGYIILDGSFPSVTPNVVVTPSLFGITGYPVRRIEAYASVKLGAKESHNCVAICSNFSSSVPARVAVGEARNTLI